MMRLCGDEFDSLGYTPQRELRKRVPRFFKPRIK